MWPGTVWKCRGWKCAVAVAVPSTAANFAKFLTGGQEDTKWSANSCEMPKCGYLFIMLILKSDHIICLRPISQNLMSAWHFFRWMISYILCFSNIWKKYDNIENHHLFKWGLLLRHIEFVTLDMLPSYWSFPERSYIHKYTKNRHNFQNIGNFFRLLEVDEFEMLTPSYHWHK